MFAEGYDQEKRREIVRTQCTFSELFTEKERKNREVYRDLGTG